MIFNKSFDYILKWPHSCPAVNGGGRGEESPAQAAAGALGSPAVRCPLGWVGQKVCSGLLYAPTEKHNFLANPIALREGALPREEGRHDNIFFYILLPKC